MALRIFSRLTFVKRAVDPLQFQIPFPSERPTTMRRNAIRRLGHLLVPENTQTSIRDAFLVSTVINNAGRVPIYPFNNRQVSIGERLERYRRGLGSWSLWTPALLDAGVNPDHPLAQRVLRDLRVNRCRWSRDLLFLAGGFPRQAGDTAVLHRRTGLKPAVPCSRDEASEVGKIGF